MVQELTGRELIQELRHALRYLYVTAELRKSRLLPLLDLEGQGATAALRTMLTEAIAVLKPDAATPPRTRPWRAYNTLLYQYIQQLSQEEVAAALGISSRQLRRQEGQALQWLAEYLVAHHGLAGKLRQEGESFWPAQPVDDEAAEASELPEGVPTREQELRALGKSDLSQVTDLSVLVDRALQTVAPLAEQLGVDIHWESGADLRVAVQPAIMQQALVLTLTAAIRLAALGSSGSGCVTVRADVLQHDICVTLVLAHPNEAGIDLAAAGASPGVAESLRMGEQLVRLAGGTLETRPDVMAGIPTAGQAAAGLPAAQPVLRLILPSVEELVVLVVDDNADSLRLFQRYLTGTRYTFLGARDAAQALILIDRARPRIVVLDVMLPEVDGWHMLAELRAAAETRAVRVIVCTILPEEQLALALGADGYLRKPVSQAAFLTALDEQVRLQVTATG